MISLAMPLAESGMKEMQYRLGRAYRDGNGVDADLKKAAYGMRKASEQNHKRAIQELSNIVASLKSSGFNSA